MCFIERGQGNFLAGTMAGHHGVTPFYCFYGTDLSKTVVCPAVNIPASFNSGFVTMVTRAGCLVTGITALFGLLDVLMI